MSGMDDRHRDNITIRFERPHGKWSRFALRTVHTAFSLLSTRKCAFSSRAQKQLQAPIRTPFHRPRAHANSAAQQQLRPPVKAGD